MASSAASTVAAYLASLPPERRKVVSTVRAAMQKNHFAAYLMGAYGSRKILAELQAGYKKAGIKLDMGKACVRFKSLEGVALDVIRDVVARIPADEYVRIYRKSRKR